MSDRKLDDMIYTLTRQKEEMVRNLGYHDSMLDFMITLAEEVRNLKRQVNANNS